MPRRRSRATYLRRRLTVAVAPVLLLAGCLALVRHDDPGTGTGTGTGAPPSATTTRSGADGRGPAAGPAATTPAGDGEPITVPATAVATASIPVAPAPTQPTPAPLVVPPGASRFVSVPAQRLFAARLGGAGSHGAPRSSSLRIAGAAGLPPDGISAVVAAVTASDASAGGDVTIGSGPLPTAELPAPGDAATAFVVVPLRADGTIAVSATTDALVTVDVEGFFTPTSEAVADGRIVPVPTANLLDADLTAPTSATGAAGTGGPDASTGTTGAPDSGPTVVPVAAHGGVPPAGASAALVQLTASASSPPGQVRAWPAGQPEPAVVLLGLPPVASSATTLAVVPLGQDGAIAVRSSRTAHLRVDVVGYITDASAPAAIDGLFVPMPATRLIDATSPADRLAAGFRRDLAVASAGAFPASGAAAVLARVRAVAPVDTGGVAVYPGGTPAPKAPSVYASTPGQDAAALLLLRLGTQGTLSARADMAVGLDVDVSGYLVGRPVAPDPSVAPVAPTPTGSASWPDFDATIEAFLRNYGVDSASVAVAKDGRLVYVHAYGTSDPATGAPTRIDDRFRFASLTKVITAAAVLRLVDTGRLDLDAPLLSVLNGRLSVPAGGDPRWSQVTIRELLGHDSGIPGSPDPFFNEAAGFPPGGATTCQAAASWAVGRGLSANPGTRFAYANMNFCLLGLVVEQVTAKPYLDAVRALALDAVGAERVATGTTEGRLPGEVRHADTNPEVPGDGWFMESLLGAGSLVGTPTDLVKVLDGLDPSKPGNHLLSTSTYGGMISPGPGSWGLGVRVFDAGFYGHTGSLASARSMAVHQPDGVTWAITTNGNFGDHGSVLFSVMSRALGTVTAWPAYDLSPDVPG